MKKGRTPERGVRAPLKSRVYTAEELDLIEQHLTETQDPLLYPFILSARYGLRAGEACAVRWYDLDLGAGILHVRGSMRIVPGGMRYGKPKTAAACADVSLHPEDVQLLWSLRKEREQAGTMQMAATDVPDTPVDAAALDAEEFVCLDSTGNIFSPRVLTERFRGAAGGLGLREGAWHDLRASFGAQLTAPGADAATAAAALRL